MSVASSLPRQGDDGGRLPPSDRLKLAVEEHRFQAQFKWSRSQYLLAVRR